MVEGREDPIHVRGVRMLSRGWSKGLMDVKPTNIDLRKYRLIALDIFVIGFDSLRRLKS